MELKLQKINPDFFFPYWDEGADHLREESSPHWQYAGTSGMPVKNGFLANVNLSFPNELLNRNFETKDLNDALPGREIFDSFYEESISHKEGYAKWWPHVNLYHGLLHNVIKGQMSTGRSPIDPLFYFHHSYYDKIFDDAQKGWKSEDLPTSAFFDENNGCSSNTAILGYGNKMAHVLDSAVNLCVRYAPRVFGTSPPVENSPSTDIEQGYPSNYITMKKCPPKLSVEFKLLMGGNTAQMDIIEQRTRAVCEETLKKIESGISIPKIPRFTYENRPVIADGSEGTVANHIEVESNYHDSTKKESDADGKASEDSGDSTANDSSSNSQNEIPFDSAFISSCMRSQNLFSLLLFALF
jgi:hypothetical protein